MDFVVAHSNIVMGLVETGVGLVPAGGGCKEVLWRWMQTDEAKTDPDFAPLKVFNIIGYGKTATSTIEAEPLKFLRPEDKKVMVVSPQDASMSTDKEVLVNYLKDKLKKSIS